MSDRIDEDPQRDHEPSRTSHEAEGALELARATRRRRRRQLALVVAGVAVALAIVAVTAAGGSSSPPKPGSAQANTTERAIAALLAGIPQSANTLGRPTAPLTLKWYGDLECPYCREFTLGALPSLIRRWVHGGELKIEYLSMETATHEPKLFQTQQVAALAAGTQDKLWNFIETFYHEQGEEDSGYVTERYLHGLASQIPGLNMTRWSEDRYDPELAAQVATEKQVAKHAKFVGTPAFVLVGSNGNRYRLSSQSLAKPQFFNKSIEYMLTT